MSSQDSSYWCDRVLFLEAAIRKHRDQRGDDRCFMDDEELYEVLPEGLLPERDRRLHCPEEMLKHCTKYIASRHDPSLEYVSPQREIERLEAEVKRLQTELKSK